MHTVYFTNKDSTSLNAKEKRRGAIDRNIFSIDREVEFRLISFSVRSKWQWGYGNTIINQ
jgi:hypothetical protein